MTDIDNHPDYLAAKAEYMAAVQVADRAQDELGKLRAENSWLRKETEVRGRLEREALVAEKREVVLKKIKEEYPLVPASLLESIQDPDQLLKVAEEMYNQIDGETRKKTSSWGNAQAPAGSGGTRKSNKKTQDNQYMTDLVNRVNKNEGGKDGAVKEYKDLIWRERVTPWHEAGKK